MRLVRSKGGKVGAMALCVAAIVWHVVGGRLVCARAQESQLPNVLLIYADDLGYGDLACYAPESKIPTPHLNALARDGMRFADAHSSSAICSPSRYALLTGRYHWRDFHNIVDALGPSKFAPERLTLPEMLQQRGYATACIGKWHLGWNWDAIKRPGAQPQFVGAGPQRRAVWGHEAFDWSLPVPDGPLDHGFEYYFGDTVINFPPYAWIEGNRLVQPPDSTLTITQKTKEGAWEARPGPARSDWDFYANLPTLTEKAVAWLKSRADDDRPFFLYFALPSPHAPIIPTDEFDGKSAAGAYGDYVVQTDWACGQALAALEAAGVADDTLVIFTADNGPERYAYARDARLGHWSAGPLRGLKRDVYEGGHRVPLIARWPGRIAPQTTCSALVSQIDLMSTLAAIVQYELPDDAAEDSFNLLPLWEGAAEVRTSLVHNTFEDRYAVRQGDWVLVDGPHGYHSGRDRDWEQRHGYEDDDDPAGQLFNLREDLGQRRNLIEQDPQRAAELRELLARIRAQRGTAPHANP